MKILLCFIFLFGSCHCLRNSRATENVGTGIPNQDHGHNADPIVRPCSKNNMNCIRRFFGHNFMCSPVHGPVSDPHLFRNLILELTHCNITVNLADAQLSGLSAGYIEEFYINKKTDALILEVAFDNLVVETPTTIATYHFKGKEPIELTDHSLVKFRPLSLTLHIRNFHDIIHAKSHVYAYFRDNKIPFANIGPVITNTKDPRLIRMNKEWLDGFILSVKEGFVVQGPVYLSAFINSMICNFGHILG